MKISVRIKGCALLSVLLIHVALGNPTVRRDVRLLLENADPVVESAGIGDTKLSLTDVNSFGGDVHEAGGAVRKKRTILKAKAAVLGVAAKAVGAGIGAVSAGVKSVAVAGAKTVGKAAFKVATTVGVKVAKAAITIGIAKLLLSLLFGTRLLGGNGKGLLSSSSLSSLSNSSGSSSNLGSLSSSSGSSGSSSGNGDAGASYDGSESSDAAGDSGIGEDLPEIDPQKVSLQIPSEIVSGGFNVVNRAAPVVGEVIQRTAERLVGVGASLKPLFASSLGFGNGSNLKRETDQEEVKFSDGVDPAEEASDDTSVTANAPSQFKRSPEDNQDEIDDEQTADEVDEETEQSANDDPSDETDVNSADQAKKILSSLLAKQVIAKILENREQKVENKSDKESQAPSNSVNPYVVQQYRNYNPHVKRQAPPYSYQNYENFYQNIQPYRSQYPVYREYPYVYG